MNADNASQPPEQVRPRGTRRGKLIFLGVALAGAVVVFFFIQRRPLPLPDWGSDLQAALDRAATENRRLLVFFMDSPPSSTAHRLAKVPLGKKANRQALEKGNFLLVKVTMDRIAREKWAKRFHISRLPTLLILGPDGAELNRRQGYVGEVAFRSDFLTCKEVQKP